MKHNLKTCVTVLLCLFLRAPFAAEEAAAYDPLHKLKEIADDPNSPIKFDKTVNEYHLVYKTTSNGVVGTNTVYLFYCPFTGEKLPKSKRGEFFTKPSPTEMKKYSDLLTGLKTVTEVKERLGDPDFVTGAFGNVKQQLMYSSLAKSCDIVIQELANGSIVFSFAGKEKK